ncbi:Fe-Mn family superoxide dismutase, partial [uncultured Campylobacter sp.]|uniref:Fe-Mn family superoxide dismutase n=1 Tax=uncultured Campylobacter sp. TaxID=218934 RepID=UPI00260C256D
ACDLWEHAYYADHQNARKSYVENFLRFADFGFASDAYFQAKKQGLDSVKLYISELHLAASSRCDCGCCG